MHSYPKTALLRPKAPTPTTTVVNNSASNGVQPTYSLQTGAYSSPRRAFPKSATVDLTYAADIAPKGLVLIHPDQLKLQSVPISQPTTTLSVANAQHIGISNLHVSSSNTVDMIPINKTPTLITGMMPQTAADGTVTYVPITLTAKPFYTQNVFIPTQEAQKTTAQQFAVVLSTMAAPTANNKQTSAACLNNA